MRRRYSQFLELIYFVGDIILLNVAYLVGLLVRTGSLDRLQNNTVLNLLIVSNLIWFFLTKILRYYEIDRKQALDRIAIKFFRVLFLLILVTAVYLLALRETYSREHLIVTYACFAVLSLIWRLSVDTFMKNYRSAGLNYRRIVVVGVNPTSIDFSEQLRDHEEYGYKIIGFFDNGDPKKLKKKYNIDVTGTIDEIETFCLDNRVDEIYSALPAGEEETITHLINFADDNVIRIRIVPEFSKYIYGQSKRLNIEYYGAMPILTFRAEPLDNPINQAAKRLFDFFFSLFTIVFIFTWLMPIIAILIKLSSKGPVFFKQQRTGENNEVFTCLKFRTMEVNKDADSKQAVRNDPRITPVGRVLRKTNLDELPQFFNVLTGKMSVVGPRPHMLRHTEEYSKIVDKFMVRHLIKPGITGMAQVKGYRGETGDPRLMEQRVKYDVWYVENWSFLLDVKIVLLTIWNMVKGEKNAV